MTDTNTLAPTDAEIIALADETRTGEPGRDGYILPISFARAVLAKFGAPAPASQPVAVPAGMEPVAWRLHPFDCGIGSEGVYALTQTEHLRGTWIKKGWAPEPLYTAAQVQAMLAAGIAPGWQAVPVEPTTKMREQGGTECGTGMLGSPEEAARVYRAMLAAAHSAPAREPLTDAQIDALLVAHGKGDDGFHRFARAIEHHHGITAAQNGGQHAER